LAKGLSLARISVEINTCNEAHHLRACVESVRPLADEIVVCDMESTDGSADLARVLGCKVISHPRMPSPNPEARTAAINATSGDWVLAFDPDMRLTPATCKRLRQIAEGGEADMVDFYCINNFFGRWCRHGHCSQPVFRKFFRKSVFNPQCTISHSFMHESLHGTTLRLGRNYGILHYSYPSVGKCAELHARYAKWNAEQFWRAGVRPSRVRMIWAPVKRFIGNYFLRRGFLDGMPGLVVSVIVSWYLFMVEAHLWDMSREKQETTEGNRCI